MRIHLQNMSTILLTASLSFLLGCSSSTTPPEAQKAEPQTSVAINESPVPPAETPAVADTKANAASKQPPAVREPKATRPVKAAPTPKALPPVQPSTPSAPLPPPETPAAVSVPAPSAPKPIVVPEPVARHFTIPSGTLIGIQMIDSIDSSTDHVGQTFHASLASPVAVDNQVVVPKGADVYVKLADVQSAGNLKGQSELKLQLDRIFVEKKAYTVESNVYQTVGVSQGSKTAKTVGIGTAIGAAIGAITGGKKGAIIGAGTGAGAGVGIEAATKGEQVRVESETRLDFRLEQPLEISVKYAQPVTAAP